MNITDKKLEKWSQHIRHYRLPLVDKVSDLKMVSGKGLELGAGTSWLSSVLSRLPAVTHLIALDIDEDRLELAKDFFVGTFDGSKEKISFVKADYHVLPFPDAEFDFIVCDAALHHAEDLHQLLEEVRRVLKPFGIFVALREPMLPSLELLRAWKRLTFGLWERIRGDIENTYTKEEWLSNFKKAGLILQIGEYFLDTTPKERFIGLLRRFNGFLFSRYFFTAKSISS